MPESTKLIPKMRKNTMVKLEKKSHLSPVFFIITLCLLALLFELPEVT